MSICAWMNVLIYILHVYMCVYVFYLSIDRKGVGRWLERGERHTYLKIYKSIYENELF